METVTLILPLEAMIKNNPSDSSGVIAGAIAVATAAVIVAVIAGPLIDLNRSTDSATIDKY